MKPVISRTACRQVIARLRERRDNGQALSADEIQLAVDVMGVSKRTVWRWIRDGVPESGGRPRKLSGSPELEELLMEHNGKFTKVAAALRENSGGRSTVSRQTVARAVKRDLPNSLLAAARDGHDGMRGHLLRTILKTSHRNELWQADCTELPVLVTIPGFKNPKKVWLTWCLDTHTRVIPGHAVTIESTTSASVLAALRDSIEIDPERGPFGGCPEQLMHDNGKQYVSKAATHAEMLLGIVAVPCHPHAPEAKGKVERSFRTVKEEFILTLPFATDGPRRANGELYAPYGAKPIVLDELLVRLDEWVFDYNTNRPHRALGGKTPMEVWEASGTELRTIESRELSFACMASVGRTIRPNGVSLFDQWYTAPELYGKGGDKVEVRYTPHDHRWVEVFEGGEWLCRATNQDRLTPEQEREVTATQAQDIARAKAARTRLENKRRARLSPATPGRPAELVSTVSEAQAREMGARGAEQRLQAASDDSALHQSASQSATPDPAPAEVVPAPEAGAPEAEAPKTAPTQVEEATEAPAPDAVPQPPAGEPKSVADLFGAPVALPDVFDPEAEEAP